MSVAMAQMSITTHVRTHLVKRPHDELAQRLRRGDDARQSYVRTSYSTVNERLRQVGVTRLRPMGCQRTL
eukprot:704915-Pleurochrysis_carterae.AAC.3